MRAVLIRIDATGSDGLLRPVHLSNVSDSRACHLDGETWLPAISRLPKLRYDFFGGSFRGNITAPQAQFSVSTAAVPNFFGFTYALCRVRIYEGNLGDGWSSYSLKFDGKIEAEPDIRAGVATFSAGPSDEWLDEPLLDTFEGTGGIEGPDDLTGQLKPRVFGNCRFVPGVLIDATDVVYMVNDGAVQAINAAYDRAASLGSSVGDYADLTALLAASIPPGRWGTSKAYGLVRLGAPPDGRPAFDVSGDNAGGYVRTPGEIISRIASIAGGTVEAGNMSDLDADRPYNLQLSLTEQTTAREVIQSLADSVAACAGITWTGKLFAKGLAIDPQPSQTLATDGSSEIAVRSLAVLPIAAPFSRLATYAEPSYVVYAFDEVATGYTVRGDYSASREYRLDDMVFGTDGAAWAYINATPSSGSALPVWPTTSNTYWTNLSPPTSWSNVYDDGSKPADNATVGGQTIALSINEDATGANNGEFLIYGYDPDGTINKSISGSIFWNGSEITVDRLQHATLTGLTNAANQVGYIVFDTAKGNPFTVNGTACDIAFAWKEAGQWKYDNNSTTTNFTPDSDMAVIGWLVTGSADTIASGGIFPTPRPIGSIGELEILDQVDTPQVVDDAITTRSGAFTAGTLTLTLGSFTYYNAQSLTITTNGEPVYILAAFAWDFIVDNAQGRARLKRDTTTLADFGSIIIRSSEQPIFATVYEDTPAAGTYTYYLQAATNDAGDIGVSNRSLIALEVKK